MKLTQCQTRELEALISDWCAKKGIDSHGVVVHIEIAEPPALRVRERILKKDTWAWRWKPKRPLKPEEWQELMAIRLNENMMGKIRLMKERGDNGGLCREDFPGEDYRQPQKFADALNNKLRPLGLRYRCTQVKDFLRYFYTMRGVD
ncbi:MAG: hypothetical protein ABSA74_02505 [Candidatus Staskawiczbacteria bacterium]|jgi:hypothetical protein